MAGVVEAIGSAVKQWRIGDRVCALLPGGGYAAKVKVPAGLALRIPDRLSFEEAAALPEVFLTAYLNIFMLVIKSAAKSKAYQVKCLNNVKQLTLAGSLYANDTGFYPVYNNPNSPGALWMPTCSASGSQQILVCPATRQPASPAGSKANGTADIAWCWVAPAAIYYGSYAMNAWLYDTNDYGYTGGAAAHPEYRMNKDSLVQKPSQTPMFADGAFVDVAPLETDPPSENLYAGSDTGGGSTEAEMGRCTIPRHGGFSPGKAPRNFDPSQKMPGAINLGLTDGHVELSRLENLWNYYWHLNWNPPVPRLQTSTSRMPR